MGTLDASVLMLGRAEPQRMFVTRPELIGSAPLFVLGVAHRACIPLARQRLESREVKLPQELPVVEFAPEPGGLEPLDVPPRSETVCQFCGDCEEMSWEDVWPRWISKLLGDLAGGFRVDDCDGPRLVPELETLTRIGRDCNNQWLSVLEADAGEILSLLILGPGSGRPALSPITPDQQALLATWAVKMALMFDLYAGEGGVIPLFFYRQFGLYHRPLPNMVVLMGAYKDNDKAVSVMHGGLHLEGGGSEPVNAFMTVFTAFRVVFKVFGLIGSGARRTVRYNSQFWDGLDELWPESGKTIEWPRNAVAFNSCSFDVFAREQPVLVD